MFPWKTYLRLVLKSNLVCMHFFWWRQSSKKCVYMHSSDGNFPFTWQSANILNEPETYTTSGRRVSWGRWPGALFCFFSGKTLVRFLLCLALFLAPLLCSLMTLHAQQWKKKKQKKRESSRHWWIRPQDTLNVALGGSPSSKQGSNQLFSGRDPGP